MKLPIPLNALDQHAIVLGKTGAGKSSAIRLMVEHLLEAERPVCIVDPKGDWWGIKASADGRDAGFPVVIFGGEHADVPINEHSGAAVAELVATGNRPSLIDLGGWMVGPRTRFFIEFAAAFFRHARGARHLVIDECHNFAPQGRIQDPDAGKMLHWANRLASEGRGKGVTLLAASQRPQKVHKDFVTSCETLVAMRVIHPLDRKVFKEWMDGCADPTIGGQILTELAEMKRGEAWAWSPEIGFGPERVSFPLFRTYDSFKPQAAEVTLEGWAPVDLDEVSERLQEVVAEAEANDPKKLKARIRELEKELGSSERGPSQKELEAEYRQGYVDGKAEGEANAETLAMERAVAAVQELRSSVRPHVEALHHALANGSGEDPAPAAAQERPGAELRNRAPAPAPAPPRAAPPRRPRAAAADSSLAKGERIILTAVAQHDAGVTRTQLSVLTTYKRSSRDTYLQKLRSAGLVEQQGDVIRATEAGRDALGDDYEPMPTGDDLREFWLNELSGGERDILRIVCGAYPSPIERDAISREVDLKRSSRDTYLQRLAARKLVEFPDRGVVLASQELFG